MTCLWPARYSAAARPAMSVWLSGLFSGSSTQRRLATMPRLSHLPAAAWMMPRWTRSGSNWRHTKTAPDSSWIHTALSRSSGLSRYGHPKSSAAPCLWQGPAIGGPRATCRGRLAYVSPPTERERWEMILSQCVLCVLDISRHKRDASVLAHFVQEVALVIHELRPLA